jgi:hypothetical protein
MTDLRPRPNLSMTPENIRTGVIVSVVVSVVALVLLAFVAVTSLMKRGVKVGTSNALSSRWPEVDDNLEVGVVREVLPAYCREPRGREKVLAEAR